MKQGEREIQDREREDKERERERGEIGKIKRERGKEIGLERDRKKREIGMQNAHTNTPPNEKCAHTYTHFTWTLSTPFASLKIQYISVLNMIIVITSRSAVRN